MMICPRVIFLRRDIVDEGDDSLAIARLSVLAAHEKGQRTVDGLVVDDSTTATTWTSNTTMMIIIIIIMMMMMMMMMIPSIG
jgi:hypothetical protein